MNGKTTKTTDCGTSMKTVQDQAEVYSDTPISISSSLIQKASTGFVNLHITTSDSPPLLLASKLSQLHVPKIHPRLHALSIEQWHQFRDAASMHRSYQHKSSYQCDSPCQKCSHHYVQSPRCVHQTPYPSSSVPQSPITITSERHQSPAKEGKSYHDRSCK